jgi:[ribosomal protein S18]-alanine N-acetyltransferase
VLRVRPATPADIATMMTLEKHAVTAAHWSPRQYDRLFEGAATRLALVIEEEGRVQGFVVAREIAAEWEIENLAVAGPARRRGLGTRLLGECLDQVRGRGGQAAFLEVRESNRAARALYEKWAFEENGRRPQYYQHPAEDAILYRLALI